MHRPLRGAAALAMAATLALLGIVTVAARNMAMGHRYGGPLQAPCAALGTYQVGPRILPAATRWTARLQGRPAQSSDRSIASAGQPWMLRGTLVLSAYSGCGQSTMGTFAVRRTMIGPPLGPGSRARCSGPCPQPVAGVLAATGTITQDAAHATNPLYVRVSAIITATRPGRHPAGQSAILSFLPPLLAAASPPPTALVLDGARSGKSTPVVPATAVAEGTVVAVATAVPNGPPAQALPGLRVGPDPLLPQHAGQGHGALGRRQLLAGLATGVEEFRRGSVQLG